MSKLGGLVDYNSSSDDDQDGSHVGSSADGRPLNMTAETNVAASSKLQSTRPRQPVTFVVPAAGQSLSDSDSDSEQAPTRQQDAKKRSAPASSSNSSLFASLPKPKRARPTIDDEGDQEPTEEESQVEKQDSATNRSAGSVAEPQLEQTVRQPTSPPAAECTPAAEEDANAGPASGSFFTFDAGSRLTRPALGPQRPTAAVPSTSSVVPAPETAPSTQMDTYYQQYYAQYYDTYGDAEAADMTNPTEMDSRMLRQLGLSAKQAQSAQFVSHDVNQALRQSQPSINGVPVTATGLPVVKQTLSASKKHSISSLAAHVRKHADELSQILINKD
ncbi:hypothetical protein RI367_007239 [Sorochytrium milnesiophthora]